MSIYQIKKENMSAIASLFEGWDETLIWSCLQGYMGTAWADSETNAKSAQIDVADFCFVAGKVNDELIKNKPKEHNSDFVILIPQNEEWSNRIEEIYENNAKRVKRYAFKKEADVFDLKKLNSIVGNLNERYELRLIDEELYNIISKTDWSYDLCSQFCDYERYKDIGLGVVALHNGIVVSGASSYTVYRDGIEIEIDTREDYRRRGLALACGAKFILECKKRGLYPSWDAQNKGSAALAQKLGYHFDKEYIAYEVCGYGDSKKMI